MYKKLALFIVLSWIMFPVVAQPIRVAVAANAQFVLRQLAADYKKKTGIAVEVISGSSGKLAAQIKHGAPYDLFLSADMEFAQSVYTDGFALTKPKIYALGSLIVASTTGADVKNWKKTVLSKGQGKIAIANPQLAPYGKAAEQTLNYFGLYKNVTAKLVFGESISQVNTYILKGVVSLGFTTESLVYELSPANNFKWDKIDPSAYEPIEQGAVLLKYAKNENFDNNKKFYNYLFSAEAKVIFKRFGYGNL